MYKAVIAFLPLGLLFILLISGGLIAKKARNFMKPQRPFWPFPDNPGLALQLARSNEVNTILGEPGTEPGDVNRRTARQIQKLDFPFIVFYVLFFLSVPLARSGWSRGWIVVAALALLTAIFDVIENFQVLRLLQGVKESSAKLFGQTKWFFYFATLAAQGSLLLFEKGRSNAREVLGLAIGIALISIAGGGIIASVRGSFAGITSATKLSGLGLLALAFTPVIAWYRPSLGVTAQYIAHLRVPLLLGSLLLALPFIAFFSSAKTLLRGLFDLRPLNLFIVTISALAVSGTVCATASLTLKNASIRFKGLVGLPFPFEPEEHALELVALMVILALPVIGFSVWFSVRQRAALRARLVIAAASGTVLLSVLGYILILNGETYAEHLPLLSSPYFTRYLQDTGLFSGYVPDQSESKDLGPWRDHLFAALGLLCIAALYTSVGVYGWWQLGKKRTVPALCSALMLLLMLGWMLPGLTFFFDAWRIPTLLIILAVGLLTAQSKHSDHCYTVRKRVAPLSARDVAPDPATTITASHQNRVIVVAANGGGIQAAAWTAQVLYGLDTAFPQKFRQSLRMISSVSGGSVGNGFFINWLINKNVARKPHKAAAMSSLDEVAWGLAWPDFLRALFPWVLGGFMDRGRALERAWLLNSAVHSQETGKMDDVLRGLNKKVAEGEIPAIIMNGTISETGERVLFATTQLCGQSDAGRARLDATELHTINGDKHDVSIVTAARLSATFPYVTPAARADGPEPKPHVVDGGYYDNYGMATLVEWLDEALQNAHGQIKSVLVIQIHGAPLDFDLTDERQRKSRGWFYQAFVPLKTLLSVRTAGQVAHNNLELQLMHEKWSAAEVPIQIHTVTFEFDTEKAKTKKKKKKDGPLDPVAPLSWHLTPREVMAIRRAWRNEVEGMRLVREFLEGKDSLEDCGCVRCISIANERKGLRTQYSG